MASPPSFERKEQAPHFCRGRTKLSSRRTSTSLSKTEEDLNRLRNTSSVTPDSLSIYSRSSNFFSPSSLAHFHHQQHLLLHSFLSLLPSLQHARSTCRTPAFRVLLLSYHGSDHGKKFADKVRGTKAFSARIERLVDKYRTKKIITEIAQRDLWKERKDKKRERKGKSETSTGERSETNNRGAESQGKRQSVDIPKKKEGKKAIERERERGRRQRDTHSAKQVRTVLRGLCLRPPP